MNLNFENPLLKHLLLHPDKKFYFNELSRLLKRNPKLLSKDIKTYLELGLIEKTGSTRTSNIYLKESLLVIGIKKIWLLFALKKYLIDLDNSIKRIILFGSFAKGNYNSTSDIDILVLVEDKTKKIDLSCFTKLEDYLDKELGLVIYDTEEYYQKLKKKNKFATEINKYGVEIYDYYKNSKELLI